MKHNFLRRVGALLLALALVLPMAVTNAWAASAEDIFVSLPMALNLYEGTSDTLAVTVEGAPAGSTITYTWSSDNTAVATVSQTATTSPTIDIIPVAEGNANIKVEATCTWVDDPNNPTTTSHSVTKDAYCPVTVVHLHVTGLTFVGQPTTVKTGESFDLSQYLIVSPANAPNKAVTWSASPSGIVTVDPQTGFVRADNPGDVYIYATSVDDGRISTFCALHVEDANIPVLTLSENSIPALTIGRTYPLTATVTPRGSTLTWTSSNEKAAIVTYTQRTVGDSEVYDATLHAVGQGTAAIKIEATGPKGDKIPPVSLTVNVGDPSSIFATDMTVSGATAFSLSAGEQKQLAVNVTPATAKVTWSSSDKSIADVDPDTGMVTAVAPGGPVTITATAQKRDSTLITQEFKVTVTAKAESVEFRSGSEIKADPLLGVYTQFDSGSGRSRTVSVDVTPANTNTYIVWTSSDTSIVTVAANATYPTSAELAVTTARPAGQPTITATVYDSTTRQPVMGEDGETPLSAELTVVVSGITLTDSTLTMYEGEAKSLTIANSYGEAAGTTATNVQWSSSDNSVATMANGTVDASAKGTTTITATTRDGKYTAKCTVTVTEDPGTIVHAGSANAGNAIKLGTSSVISQINAIARERAGSSMDYITGIFISPAQGVVYNSYTSEADTGAGVSMTERYYVNRSTPASECVGALSFVPAKTFSGEARIGYVGYAGGQPISGIISVNVTGLGEGSADVTYTANAAAVTFLADDFNAISVNRTGRTLKYVTFTPPQSSVGTLYENYTNDAHPGQKVTASTQYNRAGSPNINSVTFVPANGFSGTARISYRAVDSNNNVTSGVVTIIVNPAAGSSDPADIHYLAEKGGWASFQAVDFADASLRTIGETLSHVRFALPPSSEGTLFYNYRGFGSYDSAVASTTDYYRAGTPSLSGVAFVPATTSSGQAVITYTGYGASGTTFTGKVYIGEGKAPTVQQGIRYTVDSGRSVNFQAADFNNACVAATGASLNYVTFSLPSSTQGTLRYRYYNNNNYLSLSSSTPCYRTSANNSAILIGNVSFLASQYFTGTVTIPFTGYNTNGVRFESQLTIQVRPNTITLSGTNASPLRVHSSQIRGAVSGLFSRDLSYIEFTGLPDPNAGILYLGYSGYGTGAEVNTGTRYYVSTVPSIDQISFVPKGRYTGETTATYTAYSTSGERLSGQITFRIVAASNSSYFTDMSNYAWAAASVDYLYQNNVTNGVTATTFGPGQQILRRDFILMLYRAFHLTGGSSTYTGFADVPAGAYYAQAVSAAKQLGIVNGDGTNFMPNSQITRQDAMVMIKNVLTATGKLHGSASTTILNNFPDGGAVSSYARDAVSTLVQMGAVNGSNGMLNPRMSITRAEAAVILHFVMTH